MMKKKSNRYSKSLFRQQEVFSIRKLSLGVASVLLGSFFVGGSVVQAEEISGGAESSLVVGAEEKPPVASTEIVPVSEGDSVVAPDDHQVENSVAPQAVPASATVTPQDRPAEEVEAGPENVASVPTETAPSTSSSSLAPESDSQPRLLEKDGDASALSSAVPAATSSSEIVQPVVEGGQVLPRSASEVSGDELVGGEFKDEESLVAVEDSNREPKLDSLDLNDEHGYEDRSASEEAPKVEEENRNKRLEYFAELNRSGFSRIEIPEGMTMIDQNAFRGNTNLKEIVLPTTLTTIGYGAFENSGLEKLVLPASLTSIGDRAFAGISTLKEVVIPKNVTYAPNIFTGSENLKNVTFEDGITVIPASILAGTSVEEIHLPTSVEIIDSYAFSENKYLKKINLKDGVKAIHSGAFAGNSALAQVELPDSLEHIADSAFSGTTSLTSIALPTNVKQIGYSAFYDSGLTSIELPANLESIENHAFYSTRLSEVKLPASLKYLGWGAFSHIDSLKKVEVNSDITTVLHWNYWPSPFWESPLTDVTIKEGVTVIADMMFEGQSGITSLSLPSSLLEIRPSAFTGIGIESLSLPAGLQKLGTHSFASSSSLKSVNIPSSLVEGDGAFIESKSLVNIGLAIGTTRIVDGLFRGTGFSEFTVPEGITEIGANAFADNGNLTTIILPSTLRTIGANAFANTSLKRIVLPPGMKKIPDGLLQGTKVEEFVIPEGVEEIGDFAFADNHSLQSVVLPSSLKKIGYGAFQNTGIESIIFKDGLVEIDDYAFSNTNLQSVLLPNSVTRLGGSAFSGISTLTNLTLSEGLTEINAGTFSDTSLERVTIPSAVTVIHDSAFSGISTLKDITFSDGLKRIERSAFAGTGLTNVTLPSQLEYLGSQAFGTESLRSIHIPKSLKEVRVYYVTDGPFTGATNLQTVTFETGIRQIVANLFRGSHIESIDLPATVEEIGSSAFAYSALKEIGLQNGLKHIGASAFSESPLERITLPDSVTEIGDSAFYRTNLESIHIPDSVTAIGYSAFENSYKLKQATLSASMTYVPASMFSGTSLSSIVIPASVERIDGAAFLNTKLSQVSLPEKLKEIGGAAFSGTPLTSISFPASLEKIGDDAFSRTSLEEVTIPKTIKELGSGVFSSISTLKQAHVAKDFVGGEATFSGSSILEKVTFEEGRTAIPSEFLANTGVKEVILSKELKVIGSGAFRSTHNLKEIDFGDKLEELGSGAFEFSGLTQVTLPNSLPYLSYRVFADSTSLQSVRLPETLTTIPEEAFKNTGLLSLNLPSSVTRIERAAFANAKISKIDFSTGLETIGDGAFSGNRFEKLELPKSLKELGYSAFSDNNNLTFLYINSDLEHARYGYYYEATPFKHSNYSSDTKSLYVEFKDGVTKIPAYLFAGAKQVIRVDLPEGLKEIGGSAFHGTSIMKDESKESAPKPPANENSNAEKEQQNAPFDAVSMTRLELPDSLETIGNHAFGGIDTLTSVNIPKNLVVADQAFAGSRNLTHLRNNVEGVRIPDGMLESTGIATFIVPEGITEIGKYALRDNKQFDIGADPFGVSLVDRIKRPGLTNVILPSTLTKIDSRTFESTSIKFIDIPNGVSEIGEGAFRFSPELETVKLPKELKKLGGYLFEGNEKMTLLVLPDKVESIDVNAFVNMPNLEKVYIPASVNSIGENLIFNPNTTFYVAAGSYAEKYMKERNIPYEISGDDYKHYNDGIVKSSRFSVASQTLKQSGKLALDLNYSLDTAGRTIADKEIRITLPKGAVAFEKKIKIDGKEQEAIIENDVLRIKNSADSSRIQFVVTTKANELTQLQLAAQVLYKEYGIQKSEVLGHLKEEMPFLMIKTDTVTPLSNGVRVVGRTKPNTKVNFEVIDVMLGEQRIDKFEGKIWLFENRTSKPVISDSTGQFYTDLAFDADNLQSQFGSKVKSFKIRAVAEIDGVQVKADSESVTVSNDAPALIQFIMKHNGQEFNLLDNKANENVIFRPKSPFEFRVKFYNPENISDVWVNTVRNGVKKRIRLSQKDDVFTASAYFDESNHDFIPSGFTVEVEKYNKDRDGDGLLTETVMTADDKNKNNWLKENGYPGLIDSNPDSWDVSDRDLALFATLTYAKSESLDKLFLYDNNGNPDLSYLQSDSDISGKFNVLNIREIDKHLFENWNYEGTLHDVYDYSKGYEWGIDKRYDFHSTVSWFVDKKGENVVIAYRGSDERTDHPNFNNELAVDGKIAKGNSKVDDVARNQLKKILNEVHSKFPNYKNLYITGHSLGGYEAYHGALETVDLVENRLRQVINFNGPGVYREHFNAISILSNLISSGVSIKLLSIRGGINDAIVAGGPATEPLLNYYTIHPGVNVGKYKLFDVKHRVKDDNNPLYHHDMASFFYYLDQGYRSSKKYFEDAAPYIDLPIFPEVKYFILNLPETPNYVIDPSGRVLNSVTGKPVVNATAKVYYKDTDGKEVLWNAGDYSQLNPVLTTVHGEYAWDVPEGLWKVKIEKDGYELAESDWLPVPPPQTEVNFNLQPKTYSLEFILDGGKATSILPTSYMTEVEFALPLAEKEGYDFLGWFDNEAKTGTPMTTTLFSSVGNKKLWAGWDIPLVTAVPDSAPTTPELPSVKIETKVRKVETVLNTDVVDYYDDPTLADHLTREESGTTGLLVTELTDYYVDGVLVRTDTKEISRTEATPKKVYRGTKHVTAVPDSAPTTPGLPSVKIETKVRKVETVLTTDVVDYYDDPILADHLTREEPGTTGLLVTELTDYYVDGVLVRTDTKEISRTEATPKKVYRGTKHVTAVPDSAPSAPNLPTITIRKEERSITTSKIIHLEDADLVVGQIREEEGLPGYIVVEIIEYVVNGKVIKTEEVIVSREEATPKKLFYGTKTSEMINLPKSIQTDVNNSQIVETQKTDSKRELPQTGQENSIFPSVLGLCLLSVGTALIKSRKDENSKG
ncbi:leucine-rich repeat protein [Streptococcus suis]|uniref:leucine-rich repeat protein n=1 Tax=Streptococcus suis TaxID=1307 RepID=UPI00211904AB|nr:leucine-rich repeat protein [Streptococcus suis]MCQ8262811.1 leucine-rich repeat protein [Streptococcus suis]